MQPYTRMSNLVPGGKLTHLWREIGQQWALARMFSPFPDVSRETSTRPLVGAARQRPPADQERTAPVGVPTERAAAIHKVIHNDIHRRLGLIVLVSDTVTRHCRSHPEATASHHPTPS